MSIGFALNLKRLKIVCLLQLEKLGSSYLRQCLNLAGTCVRKQVDAVHRSIQSFPFSVQVSMECRFSVKVAP
ncbi:MAG: hypothetical protein ACXVCO_12355, partial [Ktedonobacterales bacterium]